MKDYEYCTRKIKTLIEYENNSRTHSDEQIRQIANSINEFGFTNPVLITDDSVIVAGHCRVSAAKLLGLDSVPCIVMSGITDEQMRAYAIADNQLALNSGWSIDLLKSEIQFLCDSEFDIDLLGFDTNFINELLFDVNFEPSSESEQGKLDVLEPKYTTCPHCGKEYDLRESL